MCRYETDINTQITFTTQSKNTTCKNLNKSLTANHASFHVGRHMDVEKKTVRKHTV